jgi:hypothetical protein
VKRRPSEYQYRKVAFSRTVDRDDAREQLTDAAEYGRWELARTQVSVDGKRTVWLRRKIIRMQRTA